MVEEKSSKANEKSTPMFNDHFELSKKSTKYPEPQINLRPIGAQPNPPPKLIASAPKPEPKKEK